MSDPEDTPFNPNADNAFMVGYMYFSEYTNEYESEPPWWWCRTTAVEATRTTDGILSE